MQILVVTRTDRFKVKLHYFPCLPIFGKSIIFQTLSKTFFHQIDIHVTHVDSLVSLLVRPLEFDVSHGVILCHDFICTVVAIEFVLHVGCEESGDSQSATVPTYLMDVNWKES